MTTICFNKPYKVVTQFRPQQDRQTLADFISVDGVYPAGRLDHDSEGVLLLTDNGRLQHRISDPKYKKGKTYWVQVDGAINNQAIAQLQTGVMLKDGMTRPAKVELMQPPETLWERQPPVRFRKLIPTSWIEITIFEGKNRQIRRMTAAVGFPTLRLVRISVAGVTLDGLQPGEWRYVDEAQLWRSFA